MRSEKKINQELVIYDLKILSSDLVFVVLSCILVAFLFQIYLNPKFDIKKNYKKLVVFLILNIAVSLWSVMFRQINRLFHMFILVHLILCVLLLILVVRYCKKHITQEEKDWYKQQISVINLVLIFSILIVTFFIIVYEMRWNFNDLGYRVKTLVEMKKTKQKK